MKVLFFSQDSAKVEQLVLALRLRWPDLRPLIASSGDVGLQVIEQEEPELVLLCDDLPDLGLWASIKEIRRFSDIPIIVAIESENEMEVVKALELGADDFIRMPCNLMEVMARVVALVRRVGLTKQRSDETPIRCGELLINPATYEVYLGSSRLMLTPTEFRLLHLLAKNRHVTLTQDFIQRIIWSDDVQAGETLKKYIQRLRRKLGDDARNPTWIKTVHGVGYRFSSPTTTAV
ncbi:MAG: response regulator transcription factor [Chloroflexi bacterium]|nr:response regulator transcription factor [Chloroflexota bacterium]MCH8110035.1 response regulator transcription factor [Chloroflexota bacterium]